MSTQTSPQVAHLPQSYQTTPLTATSSANLQSSAVFPNSAHSSYSESRTTDSNDENTPSKKNGHDGKIKPHICGTCHRGFTTGGHLQRHMRIHTGVKAFKCPYPGCETKTSRQDNLQQHYRTHLSPSLRRGSGSAARAAVNAAMEAAGLKSAARAPRKSKGSGGGTPSSASTSHVPSPYATPTSQGQAPYAPYLYDPQHAYTNYAIPPNVNLQQQNNSSNSSRVPSPVNGHTEYGHPQYFPQPFPPVYYPGMHPQYRYGAMPPYPGAPMYQPGMPPPEHTQPHMYPPLQTQQHNSYGMNTAYPMNGYPPTAPRPQNGTPVNQTHEEAYRNHRPPSPRRRSAQDMQGVVDPSTMVRPQQLQPPYGAYQQPMPYGYHTPQSAPPKMEVHRASVSSGSDGSGNDISDGSGKGE